MFRRLKAVHKVSFILMRMIFLFGFEWRFYCDLGASVSELGGLSFKGRVGRYDSLGLDSGNFI